MDQDNHIPADNENLLNEIRALSEDVLNLTNRNPLINMPNRKGNVIQIIDELPDQVILKLEEGKQFDFDGVPVEEDDADDDVDSITYSLDLPHEDLNNPTPLRHRDNTLQTNIDEDKLYNRLKRVASYFKKELNEKGYSSLFLAIGFLHWKESIDSERIISSPLYLYPVEISHKAGSKTQITSADKEVWFNICLSKKLERMFNLSLPEPGDTEGPEDYLKRVREDIVNKSPIGGWRIKREAKISFFNYMGQSIALDIEPDDWEGSLGEHELINDIILGRDEDIGFEPPPVYDIDEHEIGMDLYLPLDADSSQVSAIIDASEGKSIVIWGPPGTGKSQTIANMICTLISSNKRVLFVAEKRTALDVVHNKLKEIGLGDFGLAIHSEKTKRHDIFNSVSNRMTFRREGSVSIEDSITEIKSKQNEISNYLKCLHSKEPVFNKTLWEMIWRLQFIKSEGTRPNEQLFQETEFSTIEEYASRLDFLNRFAELTANIEVAELQPWSQIDLADYNNSNDLQINEFASTLELQIDKLSKSKGKLYLNSDANLHWLDSCNLTGVHNALSNLPSILHSSFCESIPDTESTELLIRLLSKISMMNAVNLHGLDNLPIDKQKETKSKLEKLDFSLASNIEIRKLQYQINKLSREINNFHQQRSIFASIGYEVWSTIESTREFLTAYKMLMELVDNKSNDFNDECLRSTFLTTAKREFNRIIQFEKQHSDLTATFKLSNLHALSDYESFQQSVSELLFSSKHYENKISRHFKPGWHKFKRNLKQLLTNKKLFQKVIQQDNLQTLLDHVNESISILETSSLTKVWHELDIIDATSINIVADDISKISELLKLRDLGLDVNNILLGINLHHSNGEELPCPISLQDQLSELTSSIKNESVACFFFENPEQQKMLTWNETNSKIERFSQIDNILRDIIALSPNTQHATTNDFSKALNISIDIYETREFIQNSELYRYFDPDEDVINEHKILNETAIFALELSEQGLDKAIIEELLSREATASCLIYKKYIETVFSNTINTKDIAIKVLQLLTNKSKEQFDKITIHNCLKLSQLITKYRSVLDPWSRICKLRRDANQYGLREAINSYIQGDASAKKLILIFEATCLNIQIKSYFDSHELDTSILGTSLDQARKRYRELDKELQSLKSKELFNKTLDHGGSAPSGTQRGRVGNYTEMGLLRHVASVPNNRQPMRSIFKRAITAITHLKPCLMMSPATVAEFLPKKTGLFDVVIIDEASQVKPGFAYGSIARSKQIVIVGDPKQLPPTNFFAGGGSAEEDPDEVSALQESESILDAVRQAMSAESLRLLNNHYRSEHQSLIAFSNKRWYNNELIIFPAPSTDSGKLGVSLQFVENGIFDNGVNQAEAEIVAQAIVDFCEEHSAKEDSPSLGVATLNRKQADLIEDILDTKARNDGHTRHLLQKLESGNEPLFINNLERVQGEERDVIYISYTYGKDSDSDNVFQRFGPITYGNGWRRLNVLFTRAKQQVKVFSSLKPGDIQGGPDKSDGVNAFRDYLIYAESEGRATEFGSSSGRDPDSDFEIAVANSIRTLGVEVDCQIGVAGYFIDLAIRQSGKENYILGIECDGATYHSSKSARDRDRVRQDIIESKGWRIHRIWSTDWFENPEHEIQKLKTVIQEAIAVDNLKNP